VFHMRIERRGALSSLLLAATTSLPSAPAIAITPSSAGSSLFRLELPPSFVKLNSAQSPDVLLFAGDFRNMIASTGAATTISVQRIAQKPAWLPSTTTAAPDAAQALAELRDSQSGLPSGCRSQVMPSTVELDNIGGLAFEFLTPLTGNGADPTKASPDLVRHTLVRAAPLPSSDRMLVLWAGARGADWDAGVGEELRAAARSFSVAGEALGTTKTTTAASEPLASPQQPASVPQQAASFPSCSNAHYGPSWAAAEDCAS